MPISNIWPNRGRRAQTRKAGRQARGGVEGEEDRAKRWTLIALVTAVTGLPPHGQEAGVQAAATADYAARAAAVPITPTATHLSEGLYLCGYGASTSRGSSTGVHDPIYARALAIAAGDVRAALVILGVTGNGNKQLNAIRNRAASLTGIPASAILVGAAHTRSGPNLQSLWGGALASYRDYLLSQTASAIQAAVSRLEPATLVAVPPWCGRN